MNLLQAICGRRAVRDFKPEPVCTGKLYRLISAAGWAPSAMNEQPWLFTVITDRSFLDEISVRAKAWTIENLSGLPRSSHFHDILAEESFHIFYNAPCLIVISVTSGSPWMREDAALAAQNLMLMATSLGLGSCWIGFAEGWLNTAEGHQLLNLPDTERVVAPIILGHPRTVPPPVGRKLQRVNWIGHRYAQGEKIVEDPELLAPQFRSPSEEGP